MSVRGPGTGTVLGRRDPCAKCGYPVFIAERLNVGAKLYHRTCFRCARCNNQLSLANCYETETDGVYCCETCPDEEETSEKIRKIDTLDSVKLATIDAKLATGLDSRKSDTSLDSVKLAEGSMKTAGGVKAPKFGVKLIGLNDLKAVKLGKSPNESLRNRSLSDEEKSKGLQYDDDEYSSHFESALEDFDKSDEDSFLSKARTTFLSTHMLNDMSEETPVIDTLSSINSTQEPSVICNKTVENVEKTELVGENPPPLPLSKPPDIQNSASQNIDPSPLNDIKNSFTSEKLDLASAEDAQVPSASQKFGPTNSQFFSASQKIDPSNAQVSSASQKMDPTNAQVYSASLKIDPANAQVYSTSQKIDPVLSTSLQTSPEDRKAESTLSESLKFWPKAQNIDPEKPENYKCLPKTQTATDLVPEKSLSASKDSDLGGNVNSVLESSDSGIFSHFDSCVNNDKFSNEKSNQRITASDTNLEEFTKREKNITKETNRSSLVKSRMLLFETDKKVENSSSDISEGKVSSVSKYFSKDNKNTTSNVPFNSSKKSPDSENSVSSTNDDIGSPSKKIKSDSLENIPDIPVTVLDMESENFDPTVPKKDQNLKNARKSVELTDSEINIPEAVLELSKHDSEHVSTSLNLDSKNSASHVIDSSEISTSHELETKSSLGSKDLETKSGSASHERDTKDVSTSHEIDTKDVSTNHEIDTKDVSTSQSLASASSDLASQKDTKVDSASPNTVTKHDSPSQSKIIIEIDATKSSNLNENTESGKNYKTVRSELEISDSVAIVSDSKNSPRVPTPKLGKILTKSLFENLSDNDSRVTINSSILDSDKSTDKSVDKSIELKKDQADYPDELNPFGDDEEEMSVPKVIKPSTEDLTIFTPSPVPRKSKPIQKSSNPFDSDEDEDEPEQVVTNKPPRPPIPNARKEASKKLPEASRKLIEAPRVSLNPFWSDEGEPSDEDTNKPVPMPRHKTSVGTPEPKPRRFGEKYDSNSSLSSLSSNLGQTPGRKKKPAPPPPTQNNPGSTLSVSPQNSTQPSPSSSVRNSPKCTPRVRKNRKAPLPPTSTPFVANRVNEPTDISPIIDTKPFKDVLSPIPSRTEAEIEDETKYYSPMSNNTSGDIETEKITKDEKNRNRQSQALSISSPLSDTDESLSTAMSSSVVDKSTHGKWKRRKGPAPARPVPQRRQIRPLPLAQLRTELDIIEMQQQGLEKQGVKLEQLIREKCEGPEANDESALSQEVEDMVLELFELVNEKNELFRKQAELMYLRRQQRLEEEYADLEYQIRCLMDRPEANKTDSDKAREEELINRLVEVVARRNEIVDCLEMDRVREAEEDHSINSRLLQIASKRDEEEAQEQESPIKLSKKEKKKIKKEKKLKEKGKNLDVDKDIDESESSLSLTSVKEKKKKKWF